jgi:predicted MFS family arabinose efflux permease
VKEGPSGGAVPGAALPLFLDAFRFLAYRRLWLGAFLSSLGTWTQEVALNWLIHVRFQDPRYFGYRSLASDTPLLAFMLLGGAVADRVDRRRILLVSQVLQMTFAAALGVLYASHRLGFAAILILAGLTGLAQSQSAPTYQAVLTTVVPPPQIPSAVALNSLQFNLSRAIGPVVGGLLLVRAGTGWCFVVNAASFLAVIVALVRISVPSPARVAGEGIRRSLVAGFRHVRRDGVLRVLIPLAGAASFLAFPLVTYLPVVAGDVLHSGAAGYSRLLFAFGVGAILGAILTAHRGGAPRRGRALLLALALYGIMGLAATLSTHEWAAMAFLFVAGVAVVSAFSMINSLIQEGSPEALRGRVLSIYGVAFRGGMPMGSLAAGFLIHWLGAPWVLASFSLTLALIAAGVYARSETVRVL